MSIFAFSAVNVVYRAPAELREEEFAEPGILAFQNRPANDHECGDLFCCPRKYFRSAGVCLDEWQPRSLGEKSIQNLLSHQAYLIDGIRSFANQDIDLESVETNLRRLHHLLSADARYHVDDSFCDDSYLAHDVEVLTEMQRKASAYTKADPEGYELADETMTRTSLCAQPTRLLFELPTGELSIRNANTATETEKVRLTDLLLPELSSMPQPAASQENSEGKVQKQH